MATLPVKEVPHGGLSLGASDYAASYASTGREAIARSRSSTLGASGGVRY